MLHLYTPATDHDGENDSISHLIESRGFTFVPYELGKQREGAARRYTSTDCNAHAKPRLFDLEELPDDHMMSAMGKRKCPFISKSIFLLFFDSKNIEESPLATLVTILKRSYKYIVSRPVEG